MYYISMGVPNQKNIFQTAKSKKTTLQNRIIVKKQLSKKECYKNY
ncbi:MAG: hypothetical protein RL619_1834 [Bacteroidota bacterium]|jgi:hypothetical protein